MKKVSDIFEIVDEFETDDAILFQYAQNGAQTRADAYGWDIISVKRAFRLPVKDSKVVRHFFEILATEKNEIE
jgi:hypothetical protein